MSDTSRPLATCANWITANGASERCKLPPNHAGPCRSWCNTPGPKTVEELRAACGPETNLTPLTMTAPEFGAAMARLGRKCEATPPYSEERTLALEAIAGLWDGQGFRAIAQSWRDAAEHCRRGHA